MWVEETQYALSQTEWNWFRKSLSSRDAGESDSQTRPERPLDPCGVQDIPPFCFQTHEHGRGLDGEIWDGLGAGKARVFPNCVALYLAAE